MRSRTLAAAALTASLALSGCSDGDPEPKFEPETSSAASTTKASEPTTDPSPTEPTLPAAAKEPTKAGAEAFVRYYFDQINYAQSTGDVATLKTLGLPDCGTCNGGIEFITEVYTGGGRITGDAYAVVDAEASPAEEIPGTWLVDTRTEVGRQIARWADRKPTVYPAGTNRLLISVHFQDGRWHVGTWQDMKP